MGNKAERAVGSSKKGRGLAPRVAQETVSSILLPQAQVSSSISRAFPLGFDDWDWVAKNPMFHMMFLRRLEETGTTLAADTQVEFSWSSSLTTEDLEQDLLQDHDRFLVMVQEVLRKQGFTHVYTYESHDHYFDMRAGVTFTRFMVYQDPDGYSCYITPHTNPQESTLWKGSRLVFRLGVCGRREWTYEVCAAVEEALRPYIQVPQDECPKVDVFQCLWSPASDDTLVTSHAYDFPLWGDQRLNYAVSVQNSMARLNADPYAQDQGKLLIFHGAPGTGKTWLLRSLFREWDKFYRPIVIQDVEHFMSSEYYWSRLFNFLADNNSFKNHRPLVVLEDAGQGLVRNGDYGVVPLQRLLNRTDGLCLGDREVTFVITFNEDIGDIDPAVVREGRCREKIHFVPLCYSDAVVWLEAHDSLHLKSALKEHTTIAELYALLRGDASRGTRARNHVEGSFGFAGLDRDTVRD